MAKVSWGAVVTLTSFILIGPIIYICRRLLKKKSVKKFDEALLEETCSTEMKDSDNTTTTQSRETLSSQEYLFGLVGYAIGIGNVWRFPYIISQNGGAAAVVAYLICLVLVAFPLFFYEMVMGQYTRRAGIACYKMINPRWESLGWAQFLLLCYCLSYYQVVVAYTLPYIVGSCLDPLPWMEIGASKYWFQTILNTCDDEESPCENGLGPIQWELALSLFIIWLICYLAVSFGRKVLAKITYVTVILPIILMTVLVIRTAFFLDGAVDGIQYYIGKFEWHQLLRLEVWAAACSQIFFSLSPGFGTAIMYSSHSHPKEDVYRTSIIVAVVNSLFSLFSGIAIFSIVGHIAFKEGKDVAEVASSSGTGLAFITIAESMEYFGAAANVVSVLFFTMLLTLGLDSSFAWIETLVGICEDLLTTTKGNTSIPTWKLTLIICVSLFLLGLPYCTRMGDKLLDVVDHFAATIFLLFISFLESLMLNLDFTYRRIILALQQQRSKTTTSGGQMLPYYYPKCLCQFDFSISVPIVTVFLGMYILFYDLKHPYNNYSTELLTLGWTILTTLIIISALTLWKTESGTLPIIKDDDGNDDEYHHYQEEENNANATLPMLELSGTSTTRIIT